MKNIIILLLIIGNSITFSQKLFEGTGLNLELSNDQLIVSAGDKKLVDIVSISFNFTSPKSVSVLSSNENEVQLKFVYPGIAEYQGTDKDLIDTVFITRLDNSLRFYSNPVWARNTTIRLNDLNEHYFGVLEPLFPNNNKSPDLRGKVIDVEILGSADQYHENYASVWSAFYMSSNGYSSFFDSFAKGQYSFAINNITELYHRTGKLDWYIFYGPEGDEMLKGYYSVIGKPKYIPPWACGPIIWRDYDKNGKQDVLDDVRKMTDLKIPVTGLMVDRPYSEGGHEWSKMNFNEKFSEPKEWISELNNKYGLQFLTWVGPMTFTDEDFPARFPNSKGYFDLTNPDAVKEFEKRLKTHQYSVNVRGHKMDRADEELPLMLPWYDNTPFYEQSNKYVYLYSKVIDQFLNNAYGKEQFNYARAAFHRTQPYLSAVWGGDSRATWGGLAGNIANAIRCSFMGFPVWGSDVGGYLGGRIPESLYARWLQFGTWSGMFEIKLDNAGGEGEDRPPWKYSEKLQNIFRDVCSQRMNMLPYIYSAANTSYKNGVLMKPLAYEYPYDVNTYDIWDEYLFGNAFLVAPIYDSLNSRSVYLPEGKWYDFYDILKVYEGNKSINVSVDIDKIPVFIKSNSIYITGSVYQGNEKLWNDKPDGELNIHFFPGQPGSKTIYNYVDLFDSDKEKNIAMQNDEGRIILEIDPLTNNSKLIIRSEEEPSAILLNNEKINYNWQKDKGIIELSIESNIQTNIDIKL
ncbi:MAG: glycoside hydrolase family 31 protein [Ignavibacteriaceae bacterium]